METLFCCRLVNSHESLSSSFLRQGCEMRLFALIELRSRDGDSRLEKQRRMFTSVRQWEYHLEWIDENSETFTVFRSSLVDEDGKIFGVYDE